MIPSPLKTRSTHHELQRGMVISGLCAVGSGRREVQSPTSKVQSPLGRGSSPTVREGLAQVSAESLAELIPILLQTGAGALAWWRLRETDLANTPAGLELHNAYRQQRLSALRHERDLAQVLTLFRAHGIEAVLVKGWAIARHYPEPALRAYGDLDLCVAPSQFAAAETLLETIQSIEGPFVDLHSGFGGIGVGNQRLSLPKVFSVKPQCSLCLSGKCTRHTIHHRDTEHTEGAQREWEELYGRTKVVEVGDQRSAVDGQRSVVRVLSDEDHLRLLCVHMLRSGARRPMWLVDIALMLSPKSRVASPKSNVQSPKSSLGTQTLDLGPWTLDSNKPFDWGICLRGDALHAEWVGLAVALAHELLGADISHTPFAGRKAPRWVVNEVLEQWGGKAVGRRQTAEGRKTSPKPNVQSPKSSLGTQTLDFGHWTLGLYRRWNNPIRATAAVGGKFTDRPQLRYRVAELIARLPELRTMSSKF